MPDFRKFPADSDQANPVLQLHGSGWSLTEADTFRCGTVSGSWGRWSPPYRGLSVPTVNIIDVQNEDHQGNGHFAQLVQQLTAYCVTQQCDLVFEFVQPLLRTHLLTKWGFRALDGTHVWRACFSA